MAEIKTKVGKMGCETCGEPVTVKTNERGTLSYCCQECDAAPYSRKGTGQYGHWVKKMGGLPVAAAPVAAAPVAGAPVATPPKPKKDSGLLL